MEHTVRQRLTRIRDLAARVEEEARGTSWDSALACAVTLQQDAAFIVDWLRGQAEYRCGAQPAVADAWAPPAEEPLGNVTGPLSGTPDADIPVASAASA